MKKEIVDRWVAALRSGKYEQGTGYLRDPDGKYCCLGVLCDISGLGEWVTNKNVPGYKVEGSPMRTSILPTPVMDWSQMGSWAGQLNGTSLADMNDTGFTFDEIANAIEEDYEIL